MSVDIYSQAKQACEELCNVAKLKEGSIVAVSYTHLRAHETRHDLVCRLLLEKKKKEEEEEHSAAEHKRIRK